jgi:hypothetical protein
MGVALSGERREGPTPAGGAYSLAFYLDERGILVEREVASEIRIVEYDKNGNRLAETFRAAFEHYACVAPRRRAASDRKELIG